MFLDVQDIYQTYLTAGQENLDEAKNEIETMCPEPMHTMLDKQRREAAIMKQNERRRMAVKDVPPT